MTQQTSVINIASWRHRTNNMRAAGCAWNCCVQPPSGLGACYTVDSQQRWRGVQFQSTVVPQAWSDTRKMLTGSIRFGYFTYCGPGSSVGIVTGYGLDGPGIESEMSVIHWGADSQNQGRVVVTANSRRTATLHTAMDPKCCVDTSGGSKGKSSATQPYAPGANLTHVHECRRKNV
jgi:hypothetical protein